MAFIATSYAPRPPAGRGTCRYCDLRVRLRYLERGGSVRVAGFHYNRHAGPCPGVGSLALDDNGRLTGSNNPPPASRDGGAAKGGDRG